MKLVQSHRFTSVALLVVAAAACTVNGTTTAAPVYSCTQTTAVDCVPGTLAYACSDPTTIPTQEWPSLGQCGGSTSFGASTYYYCCGTPAGQTSTCALNQSLASSCQASETSYSCSGTDSPDSTDTTIDCSAGFAAGNSTGYCCLPRSSVTNTCSTDSSITSCGSATAYTCSGIGSPATTVDSTLNCGGGVPAASGGGTSYCCYAGGGNPDASGVDASTSEDASTTDDSSTTIDTSTTDDSSTTPDAMDETDAGPAIGVDTGNPACDTCIDSNCSSQLAACDVPDDAGVTDNLTACEHLVECLFACLYPSADSGQSAGTLSDCQDLCGSNYSATAVATAGLLTQCATSECANACQ